MKDILVVCPQQRDIRAVEAAGLDQRYRIHFVGTDLDAVDRFDVEAFLEGCDSVPADGVVGTKDRSALLASLIAERRGLPGPTPRAVIACQFKPIARALGRAAAPGATPRFSLLEGVAPFPAPFFVKPVVGRLSQRARRIDDPAEIAALEEVDAYMLGYARIAELAGLHPDAVRGFIAEELLDGDEVTVEGYVHDGEVTIIGVTDSVKYPGTNSFERFEYPSAHQAWRQAELADVVGRVVPAMGFDGGFFNAEFFVPAGEGPAQLVEMNARISSQFWRLVQAVDGRSSYDALFALACGDNPSWDVGEQRGVALSYCCRTFSDAVVCAVPDPEDDLELLVRPGLRLSQQGPNDAYSFRLCVFYVHAPTRGEAVSVARARAARIEPAFQLDARTADMR